MTLDGHAKKKSKTGENMVFVLAALLLAAAVAAFVFRKKLVKELIGSSLSISFIASAQAQVTLAPPVKREPVFAPLAGENGVIFPRPGFAGFELSATINEMPDSCEEALSPFYLTAFVFSDISDEDLYIQVNKCLKQDFFKAKWVASFGPLQVPLLAGEKKLIEDVFKELKKNQDLADTLKEILSWIKDEGKSKTEAVSLGQASRRLKSLEGRDDIASRSARMAIYAKLGNLGKSREEARAYLDVLPARRFFSLEHSYKDAREIRALTAALLAYAQTRLERSKDFQAFLLKLYGESSEEEREELDSELDLPLGKSAQSLAKSPLIGARHPLAWIRWGFENLDKKTFEKRLDSVLPSKRPGSLAVLAFHTPSSPEKRREFLEAMQSLEGSDAPAERALYFDILENPQWRKVLAGAGRERAPLFKRKRDFYATTFESDKGILFSIYNLYKLGDFQRKHFLKALAVRSYGLPSTQILPL